ncbi:MAG: c-type cytochrome domain-containing protein, partial [Fuerstiella sp.]
MSLHRKINADPPSLQTNPFIQPQSALLTRTLNTSVRFSAMALIAALFCSSKLLFAQAEKTTTPIVSDKKAFDDSVSPFLTKYCADCHGESSNESGVVLSGISFDLASGHDIELWNTVLRQLHLEEMPPTDSEQPEPHERDAVMLWINAELKKSGNVSDLYSKLESPSFANYVNHEKLFSGEITAEPFSPARLWRTSPEVFENVKSNYGEGARDFRQPFPLEDKVGIKDYANLLFADSAVVSVLMSNAAVAADELIKRSPIASSDARPSDDILASAISEHFRMVVYREPLKAEIRNYSELFRKTATEGGNAEAMRLVLMAVMLHHESVYRVEIGLGEED